MSRVKDLSPDERERYDAAREKGTGHNLALIIATRCAPMMDRRDERWRLSDERAAWRKDVPTGKYQAGLARYPGDKTAFVSSAADARRLAKARGLKILDAPANHDNPRQRSSTK